MKFNDEQDRLTDVFNVSDKDLEILDEMIRVFPQDGNPSKKLGWSVQRVMIDERLSEQAKAYMIFTIGRFYQLRRMINDQ